MFRTTSLSFWLCALGALILVAVGAAAALYLMGEQPTKLASALAEGAATPLGVGIVPVSLWALAFFWCLARRRSALRKVNLWLGSLALVVFAVGLLGHFEADGGLLGWLTQDGYVPLGGSLGAAIAGPSTWRGALHLSLILAIGLALMSPYLAGRTAAGFAALAVLSYVASIVAFRAIRSMYRRDDTPAVDDPFAPGQQARFQSMGADRHSETALPESLSWVHAAKTVEPVAEAESTIASYTYSEFETAQIDDEESVSDGIAAQTDDEEAVPEEVEAFEPSPAVVPLPAETPAFEPSPALGGKFNRLWTSFGTDGDSSNGSNGASVMQPPVPAAAPVAQRQPAPDPPAAPAASWRLPDLELLQDVPEGGVSEAEMQSTAETIQGTLNEYGVEVEIGQVKPGPTVTMYGLMPGWVRRYKQVKAKGPDGKPKLDEKGKQVVVREESKTRVKVDSILSREKDLALALKTPSIRIETPVMGESLVGIEVPNPSPSRVTLRSVMESEEFAKLRSKAQLPVALGRGSGGETVVIDLAAMPHLLIAGATGAGKSACLNSIISCLMIERSPAEVRLLLIDPKRVELTPYNGVPHLMTPVVVETDQVVGFLKGLIREMLDRYRLFEEIGVRNIATYNRRAEKKMPLLVVAVDELADLMMSAAFDVEQSLCRLAQLGRATGIHLIVATQRPSVDVVTGLIKANFPSRISFAVTSHIDSRTILDSAGADKLLGKGDMLYLPLDASRPERVQGVFISDEEVEELVGYWQTTPWGSLDTIHLQAAEEDSEAEIEEEPTEDRDELLDKAIELAHSYSKLSTSLLQRRMRIGYPRAARLMDQLEDQGIVGPSDGSKSRDVIIGTGAH